MIIFQFIDFAAYITYDLVIWCDQVAAKVVIDVSNASVIIEDFLDINKKLRVGLDMIKD